MVVIGAGAGVVCVPGTYVCRYTHMQKPEEDVKCLHLSLSFLLLCLFLESGSFTEQGLCTAMLSFW